MKMKQFNVELFAD